MERLNKKKKNQAYYSSQQCTSHLSVKETVKCYFLIVTSHLGAICERYKKIKTLFHLNLFIKLCIESF